MEFTCSPISGVLHRDELEGSACAALSPACCNIGESRSRNSPLIYAVVGPIWEGVAGSEELPLQVNGFLSNGREVLLEDVVDNRTSGPARFLAAFFQRLAYQWMMWGVVRTRPWYRPPSVTSEP